MQVLIIGAAGMVGRKLSERLVRDKALNGKSIDKLVLVDVVAPAQPAGFAGKVESVAADLSAPGKAEAMIAGRPDVIFHLAAVVSGEASIQLMWSGFTATMQRFRRVSLSTRASMGPADCKR